MNTHHVGLTLLNGRGGYHATDRTILYSVVPRRHISSLKRAVLEKDPGPFIAFMTAEDVTHMEVGNQPLW